MTTFPHPSTIDGTKPLPATPDWWQWPECTDVWLRGATLLAVSQNQAVVVELPTRRFIHLRHAAEESLPWTASAGVVGRWGISRAGKYSSRDLLACALAVDVPSRAALTVATMIRRTTEPTP